MWPAGNKLLICCASDAVQDTTPLVADFIFNILGHFELLELPELLFKVLWFDKFYWDSLVSSSCQIFISVSPCYANSFFFLIVTDLLCFDGFWYCLYVLLP